MFLKDLLNTSAEAIEHRRAEGIPDFLYVYLKYERGYYTPQDDRLLERLRFIFMTTLFTLLSVWSWIVYYNHYKRNSLWKCLFYWLIFGFITEKFCLLSRFGDLTFLPPEIQGLVKHFRRYFLTLNAYLVVTLALYSYNLIFKSSFKSPVKFLRWDIYQTGLFTISAIPTFYFMYVPLIYGWIETDSFDQGYFTYTWQFAHYPGERDMTVLLLCCYILPACLAIFILGIVAIELLRRKEFFPFYKHKETSSLSIMDHISIAVSFYACFAFVIASIPFIVQETIRCYINPSIIDKNRAATIEIVSFCNLYTNPCFALILFAYYWFKHDQQYVDHRSENSLAEDKIINISYEEALSGLLGEEFAKKVLPVEEV
ncbi:uncharacterized protein TNIN_495031 [Trichonephila inaurata madagascariensis]|uniref:Uncharacterized protein n=2 Tax=Trichonephila inaurata madagascariensis TaxID=2747483 RepID=A0A8X6WR19_9ARAC|nr:uncharacterized protein TNIN_495031 [Trichonephila inaurata madagascariensis]